ncbi:MAG: hypothetical protein R2844_15555 [Caldilineales bacterium]
MPDVYPIIALALLAVLVVVGIAVAFVTVRTARRAKTNQSLETEEGQGRYPEGYWMGVGMGIGLAVGIALGLAIGVAMGDIGMSFAFGPGIGVAMGVAIGAGLEEQHKDEIRPLTEDERRTQVRLVFVGVGALVVGVLLLAAILIMGLP